METRYCNQRGQLDAEVVPVHNTASKAAYDDAEKGVEKAYGRLYIVPKGGAIWNTDCMDRDILQGGKTFCTQCLGANTPMDRVSEDGHSGHKHEPHIGNAVKLVAEAPPASSTDLPDCSKVSGLVRVSAAQGFYEVKTRLNMPEDHPVQNQDILWECQDHPSTPPSLLSTGQGRELRMKRNVQGVDTETVPREELRNRPGVSQLIRVKATRPERAGQTPDLAPARTQQGWTCFKGS